MRGGLLKGGRWDLWDTFFPSGMKGLINEQCLFRLITAGLNKSPPKLVAKRKISHFVIFFPRTLR